MTGHTRLFFMCRRRASARRAPAGLKAGRYNGIRIVLSIVSAVTLLLVLAEPAAAQCAMCRTALQSPEGQQLVGALRSGILLLLAAPFLVFATVATLAVRRFGNRPDVLQRR